MDTDAYLGPGGLLAERLPGTEHRPEQAAMARAVAGAFRDGRHLMVEAGTGVGKSFGYLVPAVLAALERKQTVVVSTHTIALQEQLITKDVPALTRVLPTFRAALVKGRSNYLSLRRMRVALGRAAVLFADATASSQLKQVANWSREAREGAKGELRFTPLPSVWDAVQSDHGNCLGRKCPTYGGCFYYKARRAIAGAQLLIVNHALFFADLALKRDGGSILPDYDAVVFDEAHTLEAVASDHLGLQVTHGSLDYLLGKLLDLNKGKGLLALHGNDATYRAWSNAREAGHAWFEQLRMHLPSDAKRLREPVRVQNQLSPALAALAGEIEKIGRGIDNPEEAVELDAAARQAAGYAASLEQWHGQTLAGHVYWAEPRGVAGKLALKSAPVEVGPELEKLLFDRVKSVVLTSATLSTGGDRGFRYTAERIGLPDAPRLQLGSPFDYETQAELHLWRSLPDPSADPRGFESAVIARLPDLVGRTKGGAFVLFTSNQFLQRASRELRSKLAVAGYPLVCQGEDGSAANVLDRFRRTPNAVLFGVDSFWQGVDVPGDALRCVVITKLPFTPPDQPLAEARAEAVQARGGNPFSELQVPQAALKLKQGFGRLIRSHSDRGVVALLDPRVLTKGYGKTFLDALPPARRFVDGQPMPAKKA